MAEEAQAVEETQVETETVDNRDEVIADLNKQLKETNQKCYYLGWFRHSAKSKLPASHIALIGSYGNNTVIANGIKVSLCCWMMPHAHIHRRSHQYRLISR